MSEYKVYTVEYTLKTTYTIETDLPDNKADAIKMVRQQLESGELYKDISAFETWNLGTVKVLNTQTF